MTLVLLIPVIIYKFYTMYNKDVDIRLNRKRMQRHEPLVNLHFGNRYPVDKCEYLDLDLDCNIENESCLPAYIHKIHVNDKPFYVHLNELKDLGNKWDIDYLKKLMNNEKVGITKTKNSVLNYFFADGMNEKEMEWKDFINYGIKKAEMKTKNTNDVSVYYNAQNELPDELKQDMKNDKNGKNFYSLFNQNEDESKSSYGVSKFRTENLVYWFGFDRYFTPLHYDHEDGLLCCLHGNKDVWLFDPYYTNMIGASDVFVYSDIFDIRKRDDLPGRYHIKLKPGDVLFIPQGWWHHVESIPEGDVTPYHLAITFWLYPRDEDYSFKKQLDKIGKKQDKEFKEMIRVSDLSEADKKRLESTGLWNPSKGVDIEIENPLFTDKYD